MATGGKIGKVVSSATWHLRPLPQPQNNLGKGGPPAWLVWRAASLGQILLGLKWGMEERLGPITSPQALPALQPLVPV